MIQVAKIIGRGLATTGLIGAGVGIGVVFGVTDLFALMMAFFSIICCWSSWFIFFNSRVNWLIKARTDWKYSQTC